MKARVSGERISPEETVQRAIQGNPAMQKYLPIFARGLAAGVRNDSELAAVADVHRTGEFLGTTPETTRKVANVLKYGMSYLKLTVQVTREAAFFGKVMAEVDKGAKPEDAFNRGMDFTRQTQAEFDKGRRPLAFSKEGWNVMLAMKNSVNNAMQLYWDWIRHAPADNRARSIAAGVAGLGSYLALGGMTALPFVDLAFKSLKMLSRGTVDMDNRIRDTLHDTPAFANALLNGLPTVLGLDVSHRYSMGSLGFEIPDESGIDAVFGLMGVAGGALSQVNHLVQTAFMSPDRLKGVTGAMENMPLLAQGRLLGRTMRTFGYGGQPETGSTRAINANAIPAWKAPLMALGVEPTELSIGRKFQEYKANLAESADARKRTVLDNIAFAYKNGGSDAIRKVIAQAQTQNDAYRKAGRPEYIIKLTGREISNRIAASITPAAGLRGTPSLQKGAVARAMDVYGVRSGSPKAPPPNE